MVCEMVFRQFPQRCADHERGDEKGQNICKIDMLPFIEQQKCKQNCPHFCCFSYAFASLYCFRNTAMQEQVISDGTVFASLQTKKSIRRIVNIIHKTYIKRRSSPAGTKQGTALSYAGVADLIRQRVRITN